jgi:hypothetical protein
MIIFMEVLIGTSSTHGGFWLHNWEIPRTKCWIFQLAMCDKRRYHPRFVVPCVWSTDFFIDFDDLFRPPVVPFCVFHIEDVVQMLGCASLARSPLFFFVQCSGFGSFGYETQLLLGGFKHVFPIIYIYTYGIILPIDFHIFQRGMSTTSQIETWPATVSCWLNVTETWLNSPSAEIPPSTSHGPEQRCATQKNVEKCGVW